MRAEDLGDYLALRRVAANPWEIVRFRKRKAPGRTLEVRFRDGRRLWLRSGSSDFHIFHRVFLRDEYRLRPHEGAGFGCVVDLGANVGLFAARAARLAKRVIAYEPFPGNAAQLARNLRDWPEVEAVAEAVAAHEGPLPLYRPHRPGLSGVHSAYREAGGGKLSDVADEVPATTLDRLFERHGIERAELVKIDVEGAEYDILYATGEATFARIERLYGEYHDVRPEDPRTRIGALVGWLAARGFVTELVPKRKPNLGMFYAERRPA